jgi:hypothetical protein
VSIPERSVDPAAGERLTGAVLLRLTGALVALAAGAAAVVIAIVLVRSVLST